MQQQKNCDLHTAGLPDATEAEPEDKVMKKCITNLILSCMLWCLSKTPDTFSPESDPFVFYVLYLVCA